MSSAAPNSFPTYRAIRNITLSGGSVTVEDLVLKRDIGTFNFATGAFYFVFVTAVEGKMTGAVFIGSEIELSDTSVQPKLVVHAKKLTQPPETIAR
jgi:hypothetical protein